jgi:DNA-binding MarR family transcriptional regulator
VERRERRVDDADYARLLEFRTGLRRFLRWSEQQARAAGLTPAQHQLLLAVRGHGDPEGPTVGDVANYLLLRHHSAVELIDRAAGAGLVERRPDRSDQRQVRLVLTPDGAARLERLSALHVEEIARLGIALHPLTEGLGT